MATLIEIMFEDLDRLMDQLMADKMDALDAPEWDDESRYRAQGRAEGVAWCIAVLTQSPRTPNINTVKVEAMERWEARQADE